VAIPGVGAATIATGRRGRQFKLKLKAEDRDFVSWLEGKAPQLIAELHERWKRKED
jgi:ParB family chromosome partitioning protein